MEIPCDLRLVYVGQKRIMADRQEIILSSEEDKRKQPSYLTKALLSCIMFK